MFRRSTFRRVEEFVLFDVLYEDGTRTSNRKVPASELVDIEVDLLAKTYIEAKDPQIAEISGRPRPPIKSLTRVRRTRPAGAPHYVRIRKRVAIQCMSMSAPTTFRGERAARKLVDAGVGFAL